MIKLKLFILGLLILIVPKIVSSQTNVADSLRALLNQSEGSERIQILLSLTETLNTNEPEESILMASQALALADSLKRYPEKANALLLMGLTYNDLKNYSKADSVLSMARKLAPKINDRTLKVQIEMAVAEMLYGKMEFDSALSVLRHSKILSDKYHFPDEAAGINNNMAKILDSQGNKKEALELYLQAARYYRKVNDDATLATILNNVGLLHESLDNHNEAVKYLKEAIDINEKLNHTGNLIMNYTNMGVIYSEVENLNEAENYYQAAIRLIKTRNNEYELARTYMNLGNLQKRMNDLSKAEKYYDSTLKICKKLGLEYGTMITNANLAELYMQIGKLDQAIKTFESTLEQMKQYGLLHEMAKLNKMLYQAYKEKGDTGKALKYYEISTLLNDSISDIETKKTILELEKKYNEEQNARQIAELKQAVLKQEAQNRFYVIAALIVLILLMVATTYFYIRRRTIKHREEIIQKENEKLIATNELRNKELVSKAIQIANMNEMIDRMSGIIKRFGSNLNKSQQRDLEKILREFEMAIPEKAWKEFDIRYNQVHEEFYDKLLQICPELTPTEVKICSFLRLNLNSKEIAAMTSRGIGTIDNARSKIRKKLNLKPENSLISYLLKL